MFFMISSPLLCYSFGGYCHTSQTMKRMKATGLHPWSTLLHVNIHIGLMCIILSIGQTHKITTNDDGLDLA